MIKVDSPCVGIAPQAGQRIIPVLASVWVTFVLAWISAKEGQGAPCLKPMQFRGVLILSLLVSQFLAEGTGTKKGVSQRHVHFIEATRLMWAAMALMKAGHGTWLDVVLLLGSWAFMAASEVVPFLLLAVNTLIILAILQFHGLPTLETCAGMVGLNSISCILFNLMDNLPRASTGLPAAHLPDPHPKAVGSIGTAAKQQVTGKGVGSCATNADLCPAASHCIMAGGGAQCAGGTDSEGRCNTLAKLQNTLAGGDPTPPLGDARDVAAAAAVGEAPGVFEDGLLFQAMVMQAMLSKGFGANLPAAVWRSTTARLRRYIATSCSKVLQANLKFCVAASPSMLPAGALEAFACILKTRQPLLAVRGAAMREGCILVTLDVAQLADILHSVQAKRPGGEEPGSPGADDALDTFRLLQEQVAYAGQQWIHEMGLKDTLAQGTLMSVQVLDCMHHFMWDAGAECWKTCGSELVPFGSQHGIRAQELVALLADSNDHLTLPASHAPCTLEPHKPAQPPPLSPPPQRIFAEMVLDVCMAPGEVLVGWTGPESEQEANASLGSSTSAGVVLLVARLAGCHTPVSILECTQAGGAASTTGNIPIQKQVLRVRIACEDQPSTVQFELWQRHVMLTPACEVLLLPPRMSDIAAELGAKAADLAAQQSHGGCAPEVDWDCAASPASGASPPPDCDAPAPVDRRGDGDEHGSLAAFIGDLGFWLKAHAKHDQRIPSSSQRVVELSCSTTYNSTSPSRAMSLSERPSNSLGCVDEQHGLWEVSVDKPVADTADVGCALLQQAVIWGMPNLAEMFLMDLMKEPYRKPFEELANGTLPDAVCSEQDLGPDTSFEDYRSSEASSEVQDDHTHGRLESLLNMALLSRCPNMLARVLAWGHTLGGPKFAWAWRAADAQGITPLLRIQALSSSRRELLEMALADLHAGPGLLASWLQEGPRGQGPSTHRKSSTDLHSPALSPSSLGSQSAFSGSPARSSGTANTTADVEPCPAPPTPAPDAPRMRLGGGAPSPPPPPPPPKIHARLQYAWWLLKCVVGGFPAQEPPTAVWRVHSLALTEAPTASSTATQQEADGSTLFQESNFRMWVIHQVAPLIYRLSYLSLIVPFLSNVLYLTTVRGTGFWVHLHAVPFYGGLTLLTLRSIVLSSGVGHTVHPHTLERWLGISQLGRALLHLLHGLDVIGGLYTCRFGQRMFADFVLEYSSCYMQQMPFSRFLALRALLAVAFVPFYQANDVQHPVLRACCLHGSCVLFWLALCLWHRHLYVVSRMPLARQKRQ